MKYLKLLILCTIVTSCITTKSISIDEIKGKYHWKGIYGVAESIEIKSDSTFVFKWVQGLINGTTLGKIKYHNNALRMYSELQEDSIFYKLEIPPQTIKDYYEVTVIASDGIPLPLSYCSVKKDGKIIGDDVANKSGICTLKYDNIDSIQIHFIGFYTADIPIQKNSPKSMIVTLREEFFYEYFDGQPIKKVNNKTLKLQTFSRDKKFKRL